MMMSDYRSIRKDFYKGMLGLSETPDDPMILFREWLDAAIQHPVNEPTAMVLSTVNEQHRPSARVVLLKSLEDNTFCFFTNYTSRKGSDLAANAFASLVFFWPELERQVRILGPVEKVNRDISVEYFNSRPLESRINAVISPQSQIVASKEVLIEKQTELTKKIQSRQTILECPEHWGGYVLNPEEMEFWQGGPARLHDRIHYERMQQGWKKTRLAP